MFEGISVFLKRIFKSDTEEVATKTVAKERLHLVLTQDRANVSADFLNMMKQEILEVIKKYIEVDENAIDVRLTSRENEDNSVGSPSLYANIPILNIKDNKDLATVKEKIEIKDNKEDAKIDEAVEKIVKEDIKEQEKHEDKQEIEKEENAKKQEDKKDVKTDTKEIK